MYKTRLSEVVDKSQEELGIGRMDTLPLQDTGPDVHQLSTQAKRPGKSSQVIGAAKKWQSMYTYHSLLQYLLSCLS